MMAANIIAERRTPGALKLQPFHFFCSAVRIAEDPIGVFVERRDVACTGAREAANRDASNAVGSLGVFVLPCHVVASTGRQHVDVMLGGEVLGNEAAKLLGSAEHFGTVALDD